MDLYGFFSFFAAKSFTEKSDSRSFLLGDPLIVSCLILPPTVVIAHNSPTNKMSHWDFLGIMYIIVFILHHA